MTIEEKLRQLILSEYKSVAEFAEACGVKYQTVMSILTRGVNNASITNIIKICKTLRISTEELAKGQIVFIQPAEEMKHSLEAISSFFLFYLSEPGITYDGIPLSDSELLFLQDMFELSIEMLKRKRNRS